MNARAAIFDQAGTAFRMVELPLPSALQAGELIVEMALATICGSDLHTHSGRRMEPSPCVLGHEGVGRVIASGAGRERWMGRRVTWSSADSCGQCAACAEWDLPQKCERVFKYGHATLHDASGLHGTYATHIVLRAGTHLVEVPENVADAVAAAANCSSVIEVQSVTNPQGHGAGLAIHLQPIESGTGDEPVDLSLERWSLQACGQTVQEACGIELRVSARAV